MPSPTAFWWCWQAKVAWYRRHTEKIRNGEGIFREGTVRHIRFCRSRSFLGASRPEVARVSAPLRKATARWTERCKARWTSVPTGASMSTTVRAKLCVAGGGAPHDRAGDVSAPSQVNAFGIAPDWRLEAVNSRAGVPSAMGVDARQPASTASARVKQTEAKRKFLRKILGHMFCSAIRDGVCTVGRHVGA
jgi:hypothetical protein